QPERLRISGHYEVQQVEEERPDATPSLAQPEQASDIVIVRLAGHVGCHPRGIHEDQVRVEHEDLDPWPVQTQQIEPPPARFLLKVPVVHVVERDLEEIVAASHGTKTLRQREEVAAVVLQSSVPVESEGLEIVRQTVDPDPDRLRPERLRGLDDMPVDVLIGWLCRIAK